MRPDAEPFEQGVEIDEAYVGSKRLEKALALVAAERGGRVPRADVPTDGLACYNARSWRMPA